MERVTVLGGTGFVGRPLVTALQLTGRTVRVASRTSPQSARNGVEHVRCDLETGEGLDAALNRAELVYFLVHGMAGGGDFARRERMATDNFLAAAGRQSSGRVIYLGGLYPEGELSPHLQSRREVGLRLMDRTGALAIRAGVVVGAGGASFDILYGLSQRLPLMLAPR
ncbi:MAG: NAD-dependent epimerase/dehydratase family protein, partial [Candidatus Dormibacteraeota bacterium]|nr:NAD-dependent epimerase/dehydratase family protein [Candidatus Dormibacteraeota bacterium]